MSHYAKIVFIFKRFIYFYFVCVNLHVYMCTTCGPVPKEARRELQMSQNWRYSCKSPDVGAEKRTRILCESIMCFEPQAPGIVSILSKA